MISKQQGMTFIEVLVALFILVTGVLGAVAMQATAKKGSFDAMQRSLASSIAQDIVERIRNNDADATTLNLYVGTHGAAAKGLPSPRCNTAADNCTAAQMATNDLYEWTELIRGGEAKINGTNAGGLVGAVGCIARNGQIITVVISWQGRTQTQDGGTGSCGSATDNSQRRQLSITAFLF